MNIANDLDALLGILATFSPHLNRDTILKAKIILLVAREGSCTSRYLEDALGVKQSTISRTTRTLGDGSGRTRRTRTKGFGFIASSVDPSNTKRFRYSLTDRGIALIDCLVALMREAAIKNLKPMRTIRRRPIFVGG